MWGDRCVGEPVGPAHLLKIVVMIAAIASMWLLSQLSLIAARCHR